jgi:hypothetical protein
MVTLALGVPEADPFSSIAMTRSKPSTTSPAHPITVDMNDTFKLPGSRIKPAYRRRREHHRAMMSQLKTFAIKRFSTLTKRKNIPVVMKNWDPLVFFPAFAMERRPGFWCFNWKFSSG